MSVTYKCGNCDNQIQYGSRFCSNCGTELSWPEEINKAHGIAKLKSEINESSALESPISIPIDPNDLNLFCKKGMVYGILITLFGASGLGWIIGGVATSKIYDIKCWLYNASIGQKYQDIKVEDILKRIKSIKKSCCWSFILGMVYIVLLAVETGAISQTSSEAMWYIIIFTPLFLISPIFSLLLYKKTQKLILQAEAGQEFEIKISKDVKSNIASKEFASIPETPDDVFDDDF